MMNVWPLQADADDFYGNPRGANDQVNPRWEAQNLMRVTCPWTLNGGDGAGVFTIHRKCSDSLARVLAAIWEGVGQNQEKINALRYNVFDGSFNYRPKRGGTTLSMHSYGCAIDWDAKDNEQHSQKHLFTSESPLVVEFKKENWIWGGDWSPGSIDAMHVQAARIHGASIPVPSVSEHDAFWLQRRLNELGAAPPLGVDGDIGPKTVAVIETYLPK